MSEWLVLTKIEKKERKKVIKKMDKITSLCSKANWIIVKSQAECNGIISSKNKNKIIKTKEKAARILNKMIPKYREIVFSTKEFNKMNEAISNIEDKLLKDLSK